MAQAKKVIVGEKYKTVQPFSIVMPGETGHEVYESDTASLLGENNHKGKEDVMQKMKDHAKLQSKILDDKLRKADTFDGPQYVMTQEANLHVSNVHAKPASSEINSKVSYANRHDVLEPGLDIKETVRYTYDGPYVNTEGPTGCEAGGYTGMDYAISSETNYQPAEYKSVYDK